MIIIKIILFFIVFILIVLSFTLYINQANLFDDPGISKRLGVFLTKNAASTRDNHIFEELKTPVYSQDAKLLHKNVLLAVSGLGWDIVSHDRDSLSINIIVRTRVFLFEDDVLVQVNQLGDNESSLSIKSKSRSGRADFAANSGHIQALIKKLGDQASE